MIILFNKLSGVPLQVIIGSDSRAKDYETTLWGSVVVDTLPEDLDNKMYNIATGTFVAK